MKISSFAAALSALLLIGCGPAQDPEAATQATPTPEAEATPEPTPTPTPEPTPEPIDTSLEVSVLGYHRFENPARDSLAITTEMFREQMQALKDAGVTVIHMDDFLAWRRGEKNIPARSAVITIDDGYVSCYTEAFPVLKEFGYPFTMYVYTDYVSVGGKSITWEQLAEMRDWGADIASHSISHDNMARPRRRGNVPYDEWLWKELAESKRIIEEKLGITVTTFAYPFGVHNEMVQQKGLEAGYEALFTVKGEKARHDSPAGAIGRYIVQSDKAFTFTNALRFGGGVGGGVVMQDAAPTGDGVPAGSFAAAASGPAIQTRPEHGQEIGNPVPVIEVELAELGRVDPASLEMRVSGFGPVPATFDAESSILRFPMHQRLRESDVIVQVSGRADGKRFQKSWSFRVAPQVAVPTEATVPATREMTDEDAGVPEMVPAT